MGEDIGTQTPDVSNTIEHILAEPLNLQEGTRKYHDERQKLLFTKRSISIKWHRIHAESKEPKKYLLKGIT